MEMDNIARLLLDFFSHFLTAPRTFSTASDNSSLLPRLKNRVNYASTDCAARVLASNQGARNPSAVIAHSKETSMRNLCSTPGKFVTIELCQEIRPDTLVLANYELFSSTVKNFKVFGSRSLERPESEWLLLGDFEASAVHRDQVFPLDRSATLNFIRYLKISFDTHHGNEHFCPISSIRVYGKNMLEDFNEDESEAIIDHLPVLADINVEQRFNQVASELMQVREQIRNIEETTAEIKNCTRTSPLQESVCLDQEEVLNALKTQAVLLEAETIQLSSQRGKQNQGNIYRDLSQRLKKLETLIPNSLGNFQILIPSQRPDSNANIRSPLNSLPPAETFMFDWKSIQSQLQVQQFWINSLLLANGILFLSVLALLIAFFRRRSDANQRAAELRRQPLSSLASPSISTASSTSSAAASRSSLAALSNPGVVLSDDEFLMGDSVGAFRSDGSILFSRRSVDRL